MKKVFIKRILIAIALTFALFYVGNQIYSSYFQKVKTETAIYSTIYDSIDANCFIIRDEEVIHNDNSGVINYVVEDGQKVSNGGIIATVYKNDQDVINQKEIEKINEEIKSLEQLSLSANKGVTNLATLDEQIFSRLREFNANINNNKLENISSDINSALYLMNERGLITGKISNLNARANDLNKKRDDLQSSISGNEVNNVNSGKPGYFASRIDGFEDRFNYKNILSLHSSDIKEALNEEKNNFSDNTSIGKVITAVDWYVACVVSKSEEFNASVGQDVSVVFSFLSSEKIPAKVVAINQANGENDALIILSCNHMNKDLCLLRNETVKVNFAAHKGILINKKALHEDIVKKVTEDENGKTIEEEKKVKGVYTLYGKELIFKQVVPIYSNNNYMICDDDPLNKELFTSETVKTHDEIVVEGVNLYNGKIVG